MMVVFFSCRAEHFIFHHSPWKSEIRKEERVSVGARGERTNSAEPREREAVEGRELFMAQHKLRIKFSQCVRYLSWEV